MTKTALVLGATGGIGGETARALHARGWRVRGLTRKPQPQSSAIDWSIGDAMDRETVAAAAVGATAIVHAVNPPGYRDWAKLVLPMLDNSLAAARQTGARLALPGTIYNYDPAATPVAQEDSPQHPATRKGAIRVEMERRIEASGQPALILRAGDFFGPRAGNNWLSQGMVTPGRPVRSVTMPGEPGVGHAWAYLPDVGEAFARLLDAADRLPVFARFHFGGYWDGDGDGFVRAIGEATGNRDLSVRRLPWALLPLIAPFNATMRELIEMRPFWRHPVRLDNRALVSFLGDEPHTPLVTALRATLEALGCLAPVGA
ncbi:NAD-dependent epimerase/dehydratase family protein [Hephaestia mangrovi]|uniref:NAD-dependent epimerase/dehydratase family protein n=1 Tax=Hephaestia mangrovi TaxID=2873268 RepID=UPI001CA6ACF8|nr:NAD-dependent epimerase/dehydratase family protein [Hephaestia mangrovi]MBY8829072.1 NAD(P)H-binding protein [Hephaestia mangrovi]